MNRLLVINGPNLNLLGTRRPDVYGNTTLRGLEDQLYLWGSDLDVAVAGFQSNHEGAIIDRLHEAMGTVDGVVINPGALTHYSYAIHDAVEAIGLPTVEVHISNIKRRESWRRHSVIAPACVASIYGRGIDGYRWALRHLVAHAAWPVESIRYGEEEDQVGDLRLPGGDGPHPVAVVLHGGYWRDQWKRDLMDLVAIDLATRGWASWNLEYRRVGTGGGWPTTLEDVALGVDALATFAPGHRLDLDRVAAIGHSAGGHLALWSAGRGRVASGQPGADPAVTVGEVISLAGVADLTRSYELGDGDGAVEDFLRRKPGDGSNRYDVADPIRNLPTGARTVLVHGTDDEQASVTLARTYVDAATAAGDDSTLVELEGVGHMELIEPSDAAWQRAVDNLES